MKKCCQLEIQKEQEDLYTPMRCYLIGSNADLQPKVRPQPGSLHESEEITLTYDNKGSQMEEPLTCSSKEDTLQAMDESASETIIKFEELDDKWEWNELNPLYLPTGFHEDDIVRENPLFKMQELPSCGKEYLFPFDMENAETNILQGESQGPLKVSANTLSHSEEMLST